MGRRGARGPAFENIYALPRLHALFARHGVRPTYVITHPVATDPRSAEVLRALKAGGDCEIGAHHHAWETPPCTAEDVARHPYASTLPLAPVRGAARVADRRDRARRRRAAGVVSVRPLRVLRRPRRRRSSSSATWSSRASRRSSTRRTRAGRISSRRRSARTSSSYDSADAAGHERAAGGPALGRARPIDCPRRCSISTPGRRATTRPSACSGSWASRACAGCARRIRRSRT